MKRIALLSGLLLAGCGETGTTPVRTPAAIVPLPGRTFASPDQLIGRDAGQLTALLGKPDLDVTEGQGRKLQFTNSGCVLDVYLYPKAGREPVVTWLDARQPDGTPADKGACISALSRKRR